MTKAYAPSCGLLEKSFRNDAIKIGLADVNVSKALLRIAFQSFGSTKL